METQIPIYRAKKIDSDEYVEGYYIRENTGHFVQGCNEFSGVFKIIDPSTLAIHFPNMLDSEGTKIFASLSEDGKGGDNLIYEKWDGAKEPQNVIKTRFHQRGMDLRTADGIAFHGDYEKIKVVGINKC